MIITRAPFRIPLGGGGTDLPSYYEKHGGFVISSAINKYVYIYLNRLIVEDFIRVKYSRTEEVDDSADIEHPLLREALKFVGAKGGLEIASMADAPGNTGLGSSGSFLVALLLALHASNREQIPTQALAEEACKIEIEMAGQPVGKHDQYIAAFGGLTCLDIDRDGTVTTTPLRISPHATDQLRSNSLLFYTGVRRDSFDILGEQKQLTESGAEEVVQSLHRTKEIGLHIKKALEDEDLDLFGKLLDEHWAIKKRRSGRISSSNFDEWYRVALDNGALGGKVVGAGGGGFFYFYCPSDAKGRVRKAMTELGLLEMHFDFDLEGAKVVANLD